MHFKLAFDTRSFNLTFGILQPGENSDIQPEEIPTLYSLEHPLEEVHPVAVRQSTTVNIIDNYNLKILFTSEEPSLAVIYNSQMGHHSVYHIRKLRNDEWIDTSSKYTTSVPSNINFSSKVRSGRSESEILIKQSAIFSLKVDYHCGIRQKVEYK